jgi:hypothetical protein
MRSFSRLSHLAPTLLLLFASPADAAKPTAQYWMSISTENTTIPGMEAAGGGGLEGMMGSMAMKGMGVGGGPNRTMWLDLLGPDTPASPAAEHLIPPGLKMGDSLPLVTPTPRGGGGTTSTEEGGKREDIRILLYWGCGDSVRTGQPRVLDTAKMSPEDYASVLVSRGGGSRFRLSPRKGWTYGDWPNREKPVPVPADGSLVGEHLIKGNYTPDIKFTLDERRDFMAPVVFTKVEGGLADAVKIEWKSVPNALGYFMMATGGNEQGKEIIIWTSSELADMGGGLMTYLPNATVQKYIKQKVVFGPEVTRCTVPKGIFAKTEGAALQFIAYGDEANFAYPPKPADPKAKWEPIWTAKVRLKSTGMLPLGVEGGATAAEPSDKTEKPKEESSPVDSAVEGVKKLKGLFGF